MSNVVSLGGDELMAPYEPVGSVIEVAEKILEMAQAGEIQSLTAFMQHGDRTFTMRRSGGVGYGLIGIMTAATVELSGRIEGS